MRKDIGPKHGDVVIWNVRGDALGAASYLLFKIGQSAAPTHYEGLHIWGKVFSDAKSCAQHGAIWLREGLDPPRLIVNATSDNPAPQPT